ncbi:MAG: hypothetical protein H7X93_07215 [Sphingomonadaceae bacterium]|nr:hypothetical protein [Sphingomonadaceae bacterium]
MADFTPETWIVLGLVLLAGVLLGGLMGSGGKWKRRYREEHDRYVALERERETLERGHEARVQASNERIAELERNAPAIGAGTGAAIAGGVRGSDDLSVIHGIGRDGEVRLNELGFHRYKQVARMSEEDAARVEGQLGAEPGRIERERWREQAAMLASGHAEDHEREFSNPS